MSDAACDRSARSAAAAPTPAASRSAEAGGGGVARPGRVVGLVDAVDGRPGAAPLGPLPGGVGEGGRAAVGVAVAGRPQAGAGVDEGPHPPGPLVGGGGFGGGVVVVDVGHRGRRGEAGPVGVDGP